MSDDTGKAEPPLPCPFCGERRTNICATYYEPEDREAFAVTCRTRECHGVAFQLGFGLFDTREKAIAAWNTRAAPAQCDAQSVRKATIEECAKVCDLEAKWANDHHRENEAPDSTHNQLFAMIGNAANDCADLIRALSETKLAQEDADMTDQAPEPLPEGDPQILAKLLRAIAGGTDAQSSKHDVIFLTAADWLDRWDTRPPEEAGRALRDIISIAKDAHATDALGDIVRRAEEAIS